MSLSRLTLNIEPKLVHFGSERPEYAVALSQRTVRKEMKCSGETEILHELVHDNTRKSEIHELIHVVS